MENGLDEVIDVDVIEIIKSREIFDSLSGIFPDASPDYLQSLSVDYCLKSDSLNRLIEVLLKNQNYPKKKKVIKVPVVNPNTGLHRTSVEEFLKKYNDPFQFFTEKNDGKNFSIDAFSYLKEKFKQHSVRIITNVLKQNGYNLTMSYLKLKSQVPSDLKTIRKKMKIEITFYSHDERFLDEIYFLNHEKEITLLISEKAELMRLKLEEAKSNHELIVCQCCFNEEVFVEDVITCNEGHLFCKDCVRRSTEIAFGDGKIKFDCLSECESEFDVKVLKSILSKSLYEKIQLKIQESEIRAANLSGICYCPYCEYGEIPPDGDKVFRCKKCKKESCRFCQREVHIPLSCKEYDEEKSKTSARSQIEDKMTEALVRECYKCQKKFIKLDGCNKMTCVCGAKMCYICRQPVKDYSHFRDNNRGRNDNNQASTSKTSLKCPLWSNNKKLHLDAVVNAAITAQAEVAKQLPNIHIETNKLLKGLKRKHNF